MFLQTYTKYLQEQTKIGRGGGAYYGKDAYEGDYMEVYLWVRCSFTHQLVGKKENEQESHRLHHLEFNLLTIKIIQ